MTKFQEKIYDLFNSEQGKFSYYTIGISIAMIGYISNTVLSSDKNLLLLPIISITMLFISLFTGLYYLKYRISNYYNNFGLDKECEKYGYQEWIIETSTKIMETNSNNQSKFLKAHHYTLFLSPILYFIWIIIIKSNNIL